MWNQDQQLNAWSLTSHCGLRMQMCASSSDGSLHDPGWAHSCGDPVPQTRHTFKLLVFFASECLKFPSRTSRQVLGFFRTCHPVSLLLFLFLKLAVGLHHALPLLLHHPLSGHGRLVCGADGVPEKRVEQQRLRFLLEDRRREMRRHSKEFFTSTAWWQQQGSLPAI